MKSQNLYEEELIRDITIGWLSDYADDFATWEVIEDGRYQLISILNECDQRICNANKGYTVFTYRGNSWEKIFFNAIADCIFNSNWEENYTGDELNILKRLHDKYCQIPKEIKKR